MTKNSKFEKWAMGEFNKARDTLLLHARAPVELEYCSEENAPNTIFTVNDAYPYRWSKVRYYGYTLYLYKKGDLVTLKHAIMHEMMHLVLEELASKAIARSSVKELDDSLESTIEHLTLVMRKLT